MSILVVGSVALDSVETPVGKVERALGGSATYFSMAASLYAPVKLIAVVGTDFPDDHLDLLRQRQVDLAGLQVSDGKTFHWAGRYSFDMNVAETLATELNVFADFHPRLPDEYRSTDFLFLANIDPDLQNEVLDQLPNAKLKAMDTMNFWIASKRESLTLTMSKVDAVFMNEAEVRQFAGTSNIVAAAKAILDIGPRILVVKKGEYGCVVYGANSYFFTPAYPLEFVRDPTGAGDSFAGGFLGYLAGCGEITDSAIRRAAVHGSVVASFTVQDFSLNSLRSLQKDQIESRYEELREFVAC